MTLLVRDEEDIIRENVEFHLSQGVDFIIATDNRSIDTTTAILREYEDKGVLRYIYEGEDNYNQHAWVTRMARMAYTHYGADWVINNDADEFWWPREKTLSETLARLPAHINIVRADRHNFVAVDQSEDPFWSRMIYRKAISLNPIGNPLPPKVAHRGSGQITVDQGNHRVHGLSAPEEIGDLIDILHFPVRSYQQIVNKIAKGGAAYCRNENLPESTGITWRRLYEQLQKHNTIRPFFEETYYDEKRLASALISGDIVVDRRLKRYMNECL